MTEQLVSLIKREVVRCFGEAWFLRRWSWPNPDVGHLRLKLPAGPETSCWPRRHIDLRIRLAAEFLSADALPEQLRPEVARIGCWSFDGAEQVAMTDFWILVLEDGVTQTPTCVVLPTEVLLHYLRRSADAGQLYVYFTPAGECYASPSLQTSFSALRVTHGPRSFSSSFNLTHYLNAWYQLGGSCT